MKKSILLLLAIMLQEQITLAQVSGNNNYNRNTGEARKVNRFMPANNMQSVETYNAYIGDDKEMIVRVNGLMNVQADHFVAIFNITQVGETMESTDQLMNSRVSAFKQKLKAASIDTNEIKVDMVSFVPKYDIQTENKIFSKSYNEIPAGFELQKNIFVHYKNSSKLNDIVSAGAVSEIYDLVKVDYFATNLNKMQDTLRNRCILEVKDKLRSYEKIGFRLDTNRKVMADKIHVTYPPARYRSYEAFSRPALQALKRKSGTPVLNEIAKSSSLFYDQIAYDTYDLVINPLITEPVIQVSYSIEVKYILKEEKSNVYLMNQNGDVRPINLK